MPEPFRVRRWQDLHAVDDAHAQIRHLETSGRPDAVYWLAKGVQFGRRHESLPELSLNASEALARLNRPDADHALVSLVGDVWPAERNDALQAIANARRASLWALLYLAGITRATEQAHAYLYAHPEVLQGVDVTSASLDLLCGDLKTHSTADIFSSIFFAKNYAQPFHAARFLSLTRHLEQTVYLQAREALGKITNDVLHGATQTGQNALPARALLRAYKAVHRVGTNGPAWHDAAYPPVLGALLNARTSRKLKTNHALDLYIRQLRALKGKTK